MRYARLLNGSFLSIIVDRRLYCLLSRLLSQGAVLYSIFNIDGRPNVLFNLLSGSKLYSCCVFGIVLASEGYPPGTTSPRHLDSVRRLLDKDVK